MINTFVLSNMMPQHDQFNQHIWAGLECLGRAWATSQGEIYIITGPVFDKDDELGRDDDACANRMPSNNGKRRVAIPSHFYKIFVHEKENGFIETMAFLLPHVDWTPKQGQQALDWLKDRLVRIADIEARTGIDFLPEMEETKKQAVKNSKASSFWPLASDAKNKCASR